jgi:hypothetical protein
VTVIGIYSIKKAAKQGRGKDKGAVGVRMPYLRVVGIQVIHKFFFSFISKLPRSQFISSQPN